MNISSGLLIVLLLIQASLSVYTLEQSKIDLKDFKLTEDQVKKLSGEKLPCENQKTQKLRRQFSGLFPMQLGFYQSCKRNPLMRYVSIGYQNKIKHHEFDLFWGLCVDKNCSEGEIKKVWESGKTRLSDNYDLLVKDPNVDSNWPKIHWFGISFYVFIFLWCSFAIFATYVNQKRKISEKRKKQEELLLNNPTINAALNKMETDQAVGISVVGKETVVGGASVMPGQSIGGSMAVQESVKQSVAGGEPKQEHKKKKNSVPILALFDIKTNLGSLIYPRNISGAVQAFDLIRVFCMIWIVVGHEMAYRMTMTKNIFDKGFLEYSKDSWYFTYNMTAFYAVDLFLFMGGYVAIISQFKTIDSMKPMTPVKGISMYFYLVIKRYFRIIPAYGVMLWFFFTVVKDYLSGPLGVQLGNFYPCTKKGFLESFLLGYHTSTQNRLMCAGWCWYLAVDFQIFVTIPLILIIASLFSRPKKVGFYMVLTLFSLSTIWSFIVIMKDKIMYMTPYDPEKSMANKYYTDSTQRANIYYAGSIFAYLTMGGGKKKKEKKEEGETEPVLTEEEKEKKKHKKGRAIRAIYTKVLLGSFVLILGSSLFLHYFFQWGRKIKSYAEISHACFITFGKLSFVFGFIGFFLALGNLFRGFSTAIASNRLLQLIANVSFSAYLYHFIIILLRTYNQQSISTYTGMDLFKCGLTDLTIALVFATASSVLIELPCSHLWRAYCDGSLVKKIKAIKK